MLVGSKAFRRTPTREEAYIVKLPLRDRKEYLREKFRELVEERGSFIGSKTVSGASDPFRVNGII